MAEEKRLTKEEYAALKKEERDELFSLLNRETLSLKRDREKLRDYFRVQARFGNYTITNTILILAQDRNATNLKNFFDWAARDVRTDRGARSIKLLYQSTYEMGDGEIRYSYSVKSMFDISETSRKNFIVTPKRKAPEELKELLYCSSPVSRKENREEDVYAELLSLADEVSMKDLKLNGYQKEDIFSVAYLSSLMVLSRYGTELDDHAIDRAMEAFADLDERGIRRLLNSSKESAGRVIDALEREIYRRYEKNERMGTAAER